LVRRVLQKGGRAGREDRKNFVEPKSFKRRRKTGKGKTREKSGELEPRSRLSVISWGNGRGVGLIDAERGGGGGPRPLKKKKKNG